MEDLLERPLKRQLLLYQLLIQHSRLTITDIENLTKLDNRTISKDINAMSERSEDILLNVDTDQITLDTTKIASLEFYEKTLLESSTVRLLLSILESKDYTITSLSNTLFISESTLKRQVRKLNNVFRQKALDITIKIKPTIHISGNERLIRAFFQQLLLEVYNGLTKTNKRFVSLLSHLETFLQYNIPQYAKFTTLEHIGIYLYISLIRNTPMSTDKKTEINRFQRYLINAIRQDTVFQQFLLREFKFDLCPTSIQSIITTDLTAVLWNDQQPSLDVLNINQLTNFVLRLFEKLNVPFKSEENTDRLNLLYLHAAYQQPITHIINTSYKIFVIKLNTYNANLLNEIDDCLELTNLKQHLNNDDLLYEFIYYTCLVFPELSMRTSTNEIISIGIYCLRGKLAEVQAAKFLSQYLGNRIKIHTLKLSQLNKEGDTQNLDLLLTDVPLKLQGLPTLELPLILDKYFLENLEKTINQLD
ncbi:helix-turn-helix domain-containing protein [Enterococcus faecium]|uniref:helix-turn-helix domain-containing protein n=1 Tax=Enterococcus faecium TaxID=1352 RepID=UPI000A34BF23|nr:helix-turn-helix domain-containing protein [Enterococcus faecium]OTO50611.1 hypothetical protein A5814_002779 [Enterococcus faecium]